MDELAEAGFGRPSAEEPRGVEVEASHQTRVDRALELIQRLREAVDLPSASTEMVSATYEELGVALQELDNTYAENLRRRNKLHAMLSATSLDLTTPHNIDTLHHTIVERAVHLLSATGGRLYLADGADQEVRCVAEHNVGQDYTSHVTAQEKRAVDTAMRTGNSMMAEHVHWGPVREGEDEEKDHRSVVTPMIWMERAIGAIQVLRNTADPFSDEDIELLNQFADYATAAVGYHQLLESERKQRELAGTLRDVVSVLSTTLNREQVLQRILGQLARVIDFSSASVMLISEGTLDLAARRGLRVDNQPFTPLPIEAFSHIQEVIERQRPVIIPDTATDPRWQERPSSVSIRCWLGVPLIVQDRVIGLLNVGQEEPHFYREEDARVAAAFADQAAVAIENARLYTEIEERAADLATMLESARIASSTLQLEEVLVLISEHMVHATGVQRCTLFRWDPETGTVANWVNWDDQSPAISQTGEVSRIDGLAPVRTALETRQPLAARIEDLNPESTLAAQWKARGTVAALILPLVAGDSVIGFMELEDERELTLSDAEINLAEALAAQAAVAIQNARLYASEQHARQIAEVLRRANLALTESLDLSVVLNNFLTYVGELVAYDSAHVMIMEPEPESSSAVMLAVQSATDRSGLEQLRAVTFGAETSPLVREVAATGRSVVVSNTAEYIDWKHTKSWLGTPLVVSGEIIGLLSLGKSEPDFFTEEHRELTEALAGQAGVAIQNALLYEDVRRGRERSRWLSQQLVEVQEAERRHIARELHDEVSQVLTAFKLILESSRRLPAEDAQVKLKEADDLVTELIRQVREMSLDLRPPMLDDAGLLPTLLWFFQRYSAQTEVEVRFHHSGLDQPLPEEVATATYRIVQEALTNVARYAGVSEVAVEVLSDGDVLSLRVQDNGVGFDPQSVRSEATTSGLRGIHERAALLGGHAEVTSAPGIGTALTAELPLTTTNGGDHRDA